MRSNKERILETTVRHIDIALEDLLDPESPSLTRALGKRSYEAIMMCFESHEHESSLNSEVTNLGRDRLADLTISWSYLSEERDRMRRSFGVARNAVEFAAEGFAHLMIPGLTGHFLIERANVGDGVDYWLTKDMDPEVHVFQNREARLEISGIMEREHRSGIEYIVRRKLKQTDRSDSTELPAFVFVVEFGRPIFYMEAK